MTQVTLPRPAGWIPGLMAFDDGGGLIAVAENDGSVSILNIDTRLVVRSITAEPSTQPVASEEPGQVAPGDPVARSLRAAGFRALRLLGEGRLPAIGL